MATKAIHWSAILPALCDELAKQAFRAYCANQCCERLYLTAERDADGCWRNFEVSAASADRLCVTPDPIPWSYTVERLAGWFSDRLRREPLVVIRDCQTR